MYKIDYKYEKCEICGKEVTSSKSLATHLKHNHKDITSKEYYLKYVYKLKENPKCPICKKSMRWLRPSRGFGCSYSCGTKYLNIMNPERIKKIHEAARKSLYKIDPETGKTGYQKWGENIQKKLDEPIDSNGLIRRIVKETKHSKTLLKVNQESGLTRAQEFCKKSVETKFKTFDQNGRNVFQVANDKIKEKAYSDIDPNTGLNRYQRFYLKHKGNNEYRRKKLIIGNTKFINLQGFEPQAIEYLVNVENIDPKEINERPKYIKYFDTQRNLNRIYYPDFKIGNTIYEIKSEYTYKTSGQNLIDKIKTVRLKFDMRVMIMDSKGSLIKNQFYSRIR